MSVQIALMAGMVAMSAASAASQASKASAAAGAGKDQGVLGDLIKKSQGMAAAAGTGVEIAETKLATVQQEIARRRQIAQLWQSNAIDAVGRGAAASGSDSVAAAQAYNARLGAEDIANIEFMGSSRVSKLSFRKTQLELGASMTDLDAMNISANAERRADDANTAMMFQIGGAALKGASSMTASMGGGAGGFDMAKEAKVTGGAGAFGLGG